MPSTRGADHSYHDCSHITVYPSLTKENMHWLDCTLRDRPNPQNEHFNLWADNLHKDVNHIRNYVLQKRADTIPAKRGRPRAEPMEVDERPQLPTPSVSTSPEPSRGQFSREPKPQITSLATLPNTPTIPLSQHTSPPQHPSLPPRHIALTPLQLPRPAPLAYVPPTPTSPDRPLFGPPRPGLLDPPQPARWAPGPSTADNLRALLRASRAEAPQRSGSIDLLSDVQPLTRARALVAAPATLEEFDAMWKPVEDVFDRHIRFAEERGLRLESRAGEGF
ncbi:hypothetical protein BV25DRAFT_834726 [Artomyces pyxidatus]|uniref:Uncharacterized protein n=1 Tax=Artomyces pyxidatus TaxID=48021 RepID=A0ACB8TGK4_9AGAM|nr:hypothetical protein BV25DRAFT_834726 [Artomyces pyxidatus]